MASAASPAAEPTELVKLYKLKKGETKGTIEKGKRHKEVETKMQTGSATLPRASGIQDTMTNFMAIIKPDVQRVKRRTRQHAPDNRGWFIAALGGSGMSRNVEFRRIPEGE